MRRCAVRHGSGGLVAICCCLLVGAAGCGGAERTPLPFNISEAGTNADGRASLLVEVPRAYDPAQLRTVFDRVRAENTEPQQGVFVAIKCQTGDDAVGADRLAFGRYAVGAVGASLTRLPDGEAAFSAFEGRTCAPRSIREEAVANRPAERADAYALEQSLGIRTGCGAAGSPPAAREPGCVYVAARRGCLDALSLSGSKDVAPKAPHEIIAVPALRTVYAHARRNCAD